MAKVKVTVISQKGECAFKHKVGDQFIYEGRLPDICPSAFNTLFPYIRVLYFGGNFPWEKEGVAKVACPDADNPVVFKLERTE